MDTPSLSQKETEDGLASAKESPRHRFAKILHEPGAVLNRVFNFMMEDSYMQPHHHPSPEKIEKIRMIEGRLGMIFFDDQGTVTKTLVLEKGGNDYVEIPAFTWHTYVILSPYAVTYETMEGIYDPVTWKGFSGWAPAENTPESIPYLKLLKEKISVA